MKSFVTKLFGGVRGNERSAFVFFCSLFGLVSFAQTLGLAGSESLFLAQVGIAALPLALILASLVTVIGSLLYALYVDQRRNDTYYVQLLLAASVILLVSCFTIKSSQWVLYLLFCLYYLTTAVFTNHYWTFAGDYFDILSSKRLNPLFTVGASLGGLLGSLSGEMLNQCFGPTGLVAGWSLTLGVAAALIRFSRSKLRSWGPINIQESDETSLAGIVGSIEYIKRSSLSRWLLFSALSMVMALFIAQYIYSNIFVQAFPQAQSLASFMNLYLMVTNALEIAIELLVTPNLIKVLGVAKTHVIHPILTIASYIGIGFYPNLYWAVTARINRELVENSLAGPVRNLVYNALQNRFRGRMRAFLEGVVVYSGIAIVGALLWLTADILSTLQLTLAGLVMAIVYLLANCRAQSEYLNTLTTELKAGRLDLDAVSGDLGRYEASHLSELWCQMLAEDQDSPSLVALQLTAILASLDQVQPLLDNLRHSSPKVRITIIQALAKVPKDSAALIAKPHPKYQVNLPPVTRTLLEAVNDSDEAVCIEALQVISQVHPQLKQIDEPTTKTVQVVRQALRERVRNCSVVLESRASALLGAWGQANLRRMIELKDPQAVSAAISVAGPELADCIARVLTSHSPDTTAAALTQLSRMPDKYKPSLDTALHYLSSPSVKIRISVCHCLSSLSDVESLEYLASGLNSCSRQIRATATELLAKHPERCLEAVSDYLEADAQTTVQAAINTLGKMNTEPAREALYRAFRRQVTEAWEVSILLHILEHGWPLKANPPSPNQRRTKLDEPTSAMLVRENSASAENSRQAMLLSSPLLLAAAKNAEQRSLELAFSTLCWTENVTIINSIRREIDNPASQYKADALEILSNLGDRSITRLLVLLLENGALSDKLGDLPSFITIPQNVTQALETASQFADPWIRCCLIQSSAKEELMKRLLMLRKVPLFAHMTLDQLEAINHLVHEVDYLSHEVIIREGDIGSELYILVDGSVDVVKGMGTSQEIRLATLSSINYFGEMAILDDEPRSATVVANTDSHLLSLAGENLKELVHEMPEIAFEIFRILTQRVRRSEQLIRTQS